MNFDEAYRTIEVEAISNEELKEAWESIKLELNRLEMIEDTCIGGDE